MTTPSERYDILLTQVESLQAQVADAERRVLEERENRRLDLEAYNAERQIMGRLVVERGEAEERLLVTRQLMEDIKPSDTKAVMQAKVDSIRSNIQRPLPREDRERGSR